MGKNIEILENAQRTLYCAKNQNWTDAAIKELREEHNIILRKDGCIALRDEGDMVQLSFEDDGCISFEEKGGFTFSKMWLNDAIEVLRAAR